MESFGQILKQAREDQSLTVEDLASLTRIQEHYLRALEDDRFEALPQQVFTKGFVRTYARALNMDEEDVLRRFTLASGAHYQHEEEEQEQVKLQIAESRKGKANRNVVIALIGVILVGLLFVLPSKQSPPTETGSSKTTPAKAVPIAESTPVPADKDSSSEGKAGSVEEKKPEADVSAKKVPAENTSAATRKPQPRPADTEVASVRPPSKPSVAPPAVPAVSAAPESRATRTAESGNPGAGMVMPAGEPLILNLEASEITWVVVSADDGEPHEALLQPGEKVQWKAQDHFLVTLGNAGGVSVTVDGETRGPFGKPGTVVRDVMIRR